MLYDKPMRVVLLVHLRNLLHFERYIGLFVQDSFRTVAGVSVCVYGSHRRDAAFLCDCSPGKTFLIAEPQNFVAAKDPLWTANHLSGCSCYPNSRESSFADEFSLKLGNAR